MSQRTRISRITWGIAVRIQIIFSVLISILYPLTVKSATGMWAQRKGNLSWFAEGKAETDSRSVELDEIAEIKRYSLGFF